MEQENMVIGVDLANGPDLTVKDGKLVANPNWTPEPNRVLTLEEVLALPEGTEVYTEEKRGDVVESQTRVKAWTMLVGKAKDSYDLSQEGWNLSPYGCLDVRVWLREPTPAGLAANPWPEV